MSQNGLLFTPDQSSGSGATDFVKDTFVDFTFVATNNSGLTDSALTNPTGSFFTDSDQASFGSKVLWFKDLTLLENRVSWINSRPTYSVSFTSGDFPSAKVFAYGNITKKNFYRDMGQIAGQEVGAGFAVSGKIRRLTWLIQPADTQTSKTAQLKTDGVATTTIDLTGNSGIIQNFEAQWAAFNHQASNETNDLHTFQIEDLSNGILSVMGVIVYFENTGANIQVNNGTTYINKTKVTLSNGATLSMPTAGSSMGGQILITKSSSGYSAMVIGQTSIVSTSQGVSGTNLLTVATSTGGSFLAGHMIGLASGSSPFLAQVSSVSTDTLTISQTLTFGYSNIPVYTCGRFGPTLAISNTRLRLKAVLDFNAMSETGASLRPSYFDFDQNISLFLNNVGSTAGFYNNRSVFFKGGSGGILVSGGFQAAEFEMETTAGATLAMTISADGLPGFTFAENSTGCIKRTIFTDGAPGAHSIFLSPGNSMQPFSINKINLFDLNPNVSGISFGQVAMINIMQGFISRGGNAAINATIMMIGARRRIYADQLYLKGNWTRGTTSTAAGGAFYYGTSTNAVLSQTYYGRQFALIGSLDAGGTLVIDGVGRSLTGGANTAIDPGTEGFHTITYASGSGTTSTIEAFEYAASKGDISNLTNFEFKNTLAKPAVDQKVYAKYQQSNGQVITDNSETPVVFDRRVLDTHLIVSQFPGVVGASWQAIIPRDGFYAINTQLTYAATNNWTATKTGTIYITVNDRDVTAGDWQGLSGTGSVKLMAQADILKLRRGDLIKVQTLQNTGSTLALSGPAANWVTIKEL